MPNDWMERTIKKLERRGIVSKKPHPIIPFILSLVSLIFGIMAKTLNPAFGNAFFFLAGFTFVFAVLHLIVVRVLK